MGIEEYTHLHSVKLIYIYIYVYMDASENSGTPKSSILMRVFHDKSIHFGVPLIFGNTHI